MAKAMFMKIEDAYTPAAGSGSFYITVIVLYAGADVPGKFLKGAVFVDISSVVSIADLGGAIAAAVRSDAITNGFTVPNNQLFLPSFTTI